MLLGSESFLNKVYSVSLTIGEHTIQSTSQVRNIGAMMDNTMNMQAHINHTCKGAWFLLRKISLIREYLSKDSCEKIIHAFITS